MRWRFVLFVAAIVVLGAFVHRASLSTGYLTDDYLQNAMLDGHYPVSRSPLDLYSFVKAGELARVVNRGTLPWWSHPELELCALRPLSSALIYLDHRVLGLSPYARHVHSFLWWVALVVAFALLCRELLSKNTALFATLLFAFDPAHLIPISWLANRTALVSALFGVLGFWFHVRWRERGSWRWAAVSSLCFGLALAGGEYGVCALAYVVTYEIFVPSEPLIRRLRAFVPAAIPAFVYVLLYALLGFGATASASYVSPLSAPREFIQGAALRLPSLLANELLMLPPELTYIALSFDYTRVIVVLVPLLLVGLLLRGTILRTAPREARLLYCFGLGMLLALLPLVGTLPGTRLLLIPSIGGSVLIGALFADAWRRVRERAERARPIFWLRLAATSWLAIFHVLLAPIVTIVVGISTRDLHRSVQQFYANAEIDDHIVLDQDLIVINAPDPMTLLYVPHVLKELGRPVPRIWRALAMTPRPVHVKRVARDTLELSVDHGSLTEMPIAELVRRPDLRLRPGEVVVLERLRVEVGGMGREGPRRVQFRFADDLDSPSIRVLVLSPQGLKRMQPLALGEQLTTPGFELPKLPGS